MTTNIELRVRVRHGDLVAMGPGKADLLDAIASTGSISAAGRAMGMSYRRAWQLVDIMNRCFGEPLVRSAAGGQQGGGAHVTETGFAVLVRYRAMQKAAAEAARLAANGFDDLLARPD